MSDIRGAKLCGCPSIREAESRNMSLNSALECVKKCAIDEMRDEVQKNWSKYGINITNLFLRLKRHFAVISAFKKEISYRQNQNLLISIGYY